MNSNPNIQTLDLHFQGVPQTIGAFLIHHSNGGALIECGPGSTLPVLIKALESHHLTPTDITDVFLTHIHLDHAGSAGWWANQGALVHVHNIGGPHMINPEKLIVSAKRIYGDKMDPLWGDFLPVVKEKINFLYNQDEVLIGGRSIRAIDTPGHANHHMSYVLDGVCFSGDVGGVRLPNVQAVRLPTVPPEFHLEKWRDSIQKLRQENIKSFATTHFGIHSNPSWHFDALERALDETEKWMSSIMPLDLNQDEFRIHYSEHIHKQSVDLDLSADLIGSFDLAISSQMSADGIYRYLQKYRKPLLN